ncbi:hypothetical protein [Corallococcus exiguus]|uniref:hypothetical protein n=1 Tax=Corallococcus exiguus TaxID=83462 RepID=UPI0015601A01|nr:hypothetical protein [Corallococcus exiguus]NRD53325.1 hypothetical protein [Corallococcus exiguus]
MVTSSSKIAIKQESGPQVDTSVSIEPLTIKSIRSDGFPPRVINPALLCHGDSQISTFEVEGADGFESQLVWSFDDTSNLPPIDRHDSQFVGGNRGVRVQVSAPTKGHLVAMTVSLPGYENVSDAARLRVDIPAIAIQTVKVNPRVVATDESDSSTHAIDPSKIPADVAMASRIWMQACIKIEMVPAGVEVIEREPLIANDEFVFQGKQTNWPAACRQVYTYCGIVGDYDRSPVRDYIEVYYRRRAMNIRNQLGMTTPMGVLLLVGANRSRDGSAQEPEVPDEVRGQVLAHEIGHHFGLSGNTPQAQIDSIVVAPKYDRGHAQVRESLMYDVRDRAAPGPYDVSLFEFNFVDRWKGVGFVSKYQ